nr:MAG TPA: hypothetical protein [Caudoviricetes sp.]
MTTNLYSRIYHEHIYVLRLHLLINISHPTSSNTVKYWEKSHFVIIRYKSCYCLRFGFRLNILSS